MTPMYERNYYHARPQFGMGQQLSRHSIVFWLLAINIGVFILDAIFLRAMTDSINGGPPVGPLNSLGYFSATKAISEFQIWRFITFQFLHSGIGHIFFNMLSLYFFGPMIERYLGSRRFLAFYLLCGVSGAVLYLILLASGQLVNEPWIPMVGASAGVFGTLIGGSVVAPNTRVMMLFPPIPISLRALAWIFVGFAAYNVFTTGPNAGGEAAHLGGAGLGFFLIRNPSMLNWTDGTWWKPLRPKSVLERSQLQRYRDEAEVDRILDKVRKRGIGSITKREKRALQQATDRGRRTKDVIDPDQ